MEHHQKVHYLQNLMKVLNLHWSNLYYLEQDLFQFQNIRVRVKHPILMPYHRWYQRQVQLDYQVLHWMGYHHLH